MRDVQINYQKRNGTDTVKRGNSEVFKMRL